MNEKGKGLIDAMDNKAINLLISMRPKQWTKNAFVFAALIFSKSFFQPTQILKTFYAFILFSFVSGAVYIINDIIDRERDIHHPKKSKRPIASGKISIVEALVFALAIIFIVLICSFLLDFSLFHLSYG